MQQRLRELVRTECASCNQCPAVYEGPSGTLVVQGYKLSPDARAQLTRVSESEDAVSIPVELIRDLVRSGQIQL